MAVLELAAGTNNEGFHHALLKSWEKCGQKIENAPAKSSLSEIRDKVSYHFFEDIFRKDLESNAQDRDMWRGLHVYAVDGDQLDLPASEDILKHGYRGYPTSKNRETYYPKMYTAHVYDILSETTREFCFSSTQDEVHLSRSVVPSLERNSLSIYDRLHCGYDTVRAHEEAGNFFLIRARTNKKGNRGRGVHNGVGAFCESRRTDSEITWTPPCGFRRIHPKIDVRVVKVKNPRTNRNHIFITNLPKDKFSRKTIGELYRRRWDIETSFRDLTHTMKLGQWHSKKLNGVLQEIFALLWLRNVSKRQMKKCIERPPDLLKKRYQKANLKLVMKGVLENFGLLFKGKMIKFYKIITSWIKRTVERRERGKRSYPRVVKHRGREYKQANAVPRRPKPLTERH